MNVSQALEASVMSQTITGHFDGKVIVPDKPL